MFQRVKQILVVEDDLEFAQQIAKALKGALEPWSVHQCYTAAQALALLQQPKFFLDLALVDLGLPDLNGIEVIRATRNRFANIPIMVMSVISNEQSVLSAIRAGARGYLLKDESSSSIAAAIEEVMSGNYPISPALARCLFRLAGAPGSLIADGAMSLTPKELETLRHLAKGHSYREVASLMGVSLSTIQSHVRSLYSKLEVHTQVQAITKAMQRGLL